MRAKKFELQVPHWARDNGRGRWSVPTTADEWAKSIETRRRVYDMEVKARGRGEPELTEARHD